MPEGILANQFVGSPEAALRECVGHQQALQSSQVDLVAAISKLKHNKVLREQEDERN